MTLKIQRTTVTEVTGDKAKLHIQISDAEELEKSSEYIVLSLVVDRAPTVHRVGVLQSVALEKTVALVDEVSRALLQKPSSNR